MAQHLPPRSTIYMPRLPEDYGIIMGHVPTQAEVRERYQVRGRAVSAPLDLRANPAWPPCPTPCHPKLHPQVDCVEYVDAMPGHLRGEAAPTLLLLEGPNTDSGKTTR